VPRALGEVECIPPTVAPAIRHDAKRLDEALPAARERDRHAEIQDLVDGEIWRSASWNAGSIVGRSPVIRSAKPSAIFVRSGKSDAS
jgi:hypothetical protein